MARAAEFQTIRSEGGLLPPDLLRRVLDPRAKLEGTSPKDYGLPENERLNEVITQAWNRLGRHWVEYRRSAESLGDGDAGTGLTNEKWTLPLLRELGFGTVPTSPAPEVGGRTYPINRFLGPVPLHLIGRGLPLDRRTAGARGAAAGNPHGMVQEFLNRSDQHLWAILSNGRLLRILRDNQALSRQSFIEFDLEAMFDGEVYPDFVLMWMVAHATRFLPPEGKTASDCLLERWTRIAEVDGTRALGDLRVGVVKALQQLGSGFTSHPRNVDLRAALSENRLSPADLHAQLLRVVYRLIFLFVSEDRLIEGQPLLHPVDASEAAQEARRRYASHYSTARLRELAGSIRGSRHGDLWRQFKLVSGFLSGESSLEGARKALALPALGGFLWSGDATPALNGAELSNDDFLEALRHLAFTQQGRTRRSVDFKNMGAEELGGVYETLLELTPQVSGGGTGFSFVEFAGNERKTSGSYYTPDSLVQCLLDSALEPVIAEAIAGKSPTEAEAAIMALTVCDPAVGSGHFLVGAAHRLARHLARVRAAAEGDSEPSPLLYQHALRDVIGRCLYGVDINPMSAELCRVGLWLEAMEPGKPLSFLDHHIRVGNSLLGATPELITAGLPDEAFTAIEGDDKAACAELKKLNKGARKAAGPMFAAEHAAKVGALARAAANVAEMPDDRPEDVRAKERAHRRNEEAAEFRRAKRIADVWCAAFVYEKTMAPAPAGAVGRGRANGITQAHIINLANGGDLSDEQQSSVERLASQYQFFHWHIVFPEVFESGGFDCVLGNPPWERVKLQEKEWFSERVPEIAQAPNAAARKRMIAELVNTDPGLHRAFLAESRRAQGESQFLRVSNRYPLCGRGDINLYTVFAEIMRQLVHGRGRAGCVLPSGIATDDTTKHFFQNVVDTRALISMFDFENKRLVFPDVAPVLKFCLLTCGSGTMPIAEQAEFLFFAHGIEDLSDTERRFTLTAADIELVNPNTRTCPIFRTRADAELTKAICRRVPVLIREARGDEPEVNPWGVRFATMFHMSNDSHLFRTREELEADGWTLVGSVFHRGPLQCLPLYEAKLFHQFDHRPSTFEGVPVSDRFKVKAPTRALSAMNKLDPWLAMIPRYWVSVEDVAARNGTQSSWFMAFRDMTNVMTNKRNAVLTFLPLAGVGHSAPTVILADPKWATSFCSAVNSYVFDYVTRQCLGGGHLTYFILKQLPIHGPSDTYSRPAPWDRSLTIHTWLASRVLELTYTAWDMKAFGADCGWTEAPFRWDEHRRQLLRCELDAAQFVLYFNPGADGNWIRANGETDRDWALLRDRFQNPRQAVLHVMNSFEIVRRTEDAQYGEFRSRQIILEMYDAMEAAIRSGQRYQTRLNPPPADIRCCHSRVQRDTT